MNIQDQFLFFFSALGAFNGLLLSAYIAFFLKSKTKANYFLAALLFAVSVRVTKSVFLVYDPNISNAFIQAGLTACALIGPFLYLYVRTTIDAENYKKWSWVFHVMPVLVIMILIGYYFPYRENKYLWQRRIDGYFCWPLFIQWIGYILLSGILIKDSFQKLLSKNEKLNNTDIWLINIIVGMGIIWFAYFTNNYTSYIVGALSFSFTFYLSILLWSFKKGRAAIFYEKPSKYGDKKIGNKASKEIALKLELLFKEKELYKNPNLKLSEVAKQLDILPHYLSQYLNDNLGKSFSLFINEYRIEAAKQELLTNKNYTIEAIGYECGFNSKSTFFSSFKKITGLTPHSYKEKNKKPSL